MKKILVFWLIVCVANIAVSEVQTVVVDDNTTMHSVFHSNNQKVVSNQYGIFMVYNTEPDVNGEYLWHLMQSTDGGETFSSIYSARDGTYTPVIETDSAGNIYLAYNDHYSQYGWLYKFTAPSYTSPTVVSFTDSGSGGKFAMVIDEPRNRLYFMNAYNADLIIHDLNCNLIDINPIISGGYTPQYTHFVLDENGTLHFAWTYDPSGSHKYESIFYVRSTDGGYSWEDMAGQSVTVPFYCYYSGPATEITEASEHGHTTWLANMAYKDGKLHFFYNYYCDTWPYNSDPIYNRYKRFNAQTGALEINKWGFEQDDRYFYALDGFFSVDRACENEILLGYEPPTADINEDCKVDMLDFSRLAENWLEERIPIRPKSNYR